MIVSCIKLIHLVMLFIWIGSLFTITWLLSTQTKEDDQIKKRIHLLIKKMYFLVSLPAMISAISTAAVLLFLKDVNFKAGWLHIKLTCAFLLILCDWRVGRMVVNAQKKRLKSLSIRLTHFSILFLLIGALTSIYVYRDKEAELREKILSEYVRDTQSLDWQKSSKHI